MSEYFFTILEVLIQLSDLKKHEDSDVVPKTEKSCVDKLAEIEATFKNAKQVLSMAVQDGFLPYYADETAATKCDKKSPVTVNLIPPTQKFKYPQSETTDRQMTGKFFNVVSNRRCF